jgi:hypothetical protein
MDTIKKYKQEIRKMFFISIKKDSSLWLYDRYTPMYFKTFDGFYLKIDMSVNTLILVGSIDKLAVETKISHYKWKFIPLDFKVFFYLKKLKKNLKKIENDRINMNTINFLKNSLSKIEESYIKEIRKEKLLHLKK